MTYPITSFLILYRGPNKDYAWGKWVKLGFVFRGGAFSSDGKLIVTLPDFLSTIFIFRSADGMLLHTYSIGNSQNYLQSKRNMLISSEAIRKIYVHNHIKDANPATGYMLLSMTFAPA